MTEYYKKPADLITPEKVRHLSRINQAASFIKYDGRSIKDVQKNLENIDSPTVNLAGGGSTPQPKDIPQTVIDQYTESRGIKERYMLSCEERDHAEESIKEGIHGKIVNAIITSERETLVTEYCALLFEIIKRDEEESFDLAFDKLKKTFMKASSAISDKRKKDAIAIHEEIVKYPHIEILRITRTIRRSLQLLIETFGSEILNDECRPDTELIFNKVFFHAQRETALLFANQSLPTIMQNYPKVGMEVKEACDAMLEEKDKLIEIVANKSPLANIEVTINAINDLFEKIDAVRNRLYNQISPSVDTSTAALETHLYQQIAIPEGTSSPTVKETTKPTRQGCLTLLINFFKWRK